MATVGRSTWLEAWEVDLTPSPAARRSEARVAAHMRSTRYYTREAVARVPQVVERPLEAQPEPVRPAPRIKLVTRGRSRWGLAVLTFLFSAVLLGALIVAPVLINSTTTQMESDIGQTQRTEQHFMAETAALSAQISALSAPDRVAEQASRLGLVPAQSVKYVGAVNEPSATEGETTVAER